MERTITVEEKVSIVLIGHFSPGMFSLQWLKDNKCIREEDYNAMIEGKNFVNAPNISAVNTPTFEFQVTENRISFLSRAKPFLIVLDFFKNLFQNLGSLPILKYGFNYDSVVNFPAVADAQFFADELTPKPVWCDFLGEDVKGEDRRGGFASLSMVKLSPEGTAFTFRLSNVSKKPRVDGKGYSPSILFAINEHHDLEKETFSYDVMKEIDRSFESAIEKLKSFKESLIKNVFEKQQ